MAFEDWFPKSYPATLKGASRRMAAEADAARESAERRMLFGGPSRPSSLVDEARRMDSQEHWEMLNGYRAQVNGWIANSSFDPTRGIWRDNPSGILLPKAEAIVRTEAEMWADIERAKDDAVAEAQKIVDDAYFATEREAMDVILVTGFTNAKGYIARKSELDRKEKARELSGLIAEYGQIYPMNKFITEETIKMICEKYNLYFTEAKKFIGEIPDRCLKEIMAFKVRRKDMRYKNLDYSSLYTEEQQAEFLPGQTMSIMAPMSELNYQEGYDRKRGHVVFDDPIVLQPVNGGFLIVTSWGKEAADPAIVNPNHN